MNRANVPDSTPPVLWLGHRCGGWATSGQTLAATGASGLLVARPRCAIWGLPCEHTFNSRFSTFCPKLQETRTSCVNNRVPYVPVVVVVVVVAVVVVVMFTASRAEGRHPTRCS